MTLLSNSIFSSVAFGHLIVDLLNGSRPVLLAYLSGPLGLTNTTIGIISTAYVWAASLSQPVFGWITDRVGPRLLGAGGILWMAVFFSLAMVLPGYMPLFSLVIASLGSAAFHPAGTMQATLIGQRQYAGRETTAASYFFLFGQAGLFFGPMITGPLLDSFGMIGLLLPASLTIPIGLNAARQLRSTNLRFDSVTQVQTNEDRQAVRPGFFLLLAAVAALQAWAQQNMITFVPKYLSDLGQAATTYGLIAGLFMGGSALGNVVGGNLADRLGKRRVAATALILATIPLYVISQVGWSPWLYVLVPMAGSMTGAVHSILVVMAQRIIPGGMAMASGLALGFMFSAGALGTLLSGPLADRWGFPLVFQLTAGLVFIASILALQLPGQRKTAVN